MFGLKLLWQKWFAYLFGLGSPSRSSSFEGRSGTLATKSFKKSNWFSDVIHLFLWIQTLKNLKTSWNNILIHKLGWIQDLTKGGSDKRPLKEVAPRGVQEHAPPPPPPENF